MAVRLLFIHALTSVHAGTGQGVGTIDLPIARERATNLPVIPGSTLKGCLRANITHNQAAVADDLFGTAESQGKVNISDARLLLLPVRSAGTTFVWATCPYVLRRLQRDCELMKIGKPPEKLPNPREEEADVSDKSAAILVGGTPRLVLEDLDFSVREDAAKPWAEWIGKNLFPNDKGWLQELMKRFAVLNDASFDFLCEFATEVNAHIRIGPNGVVESGALWYEESLPAETVLVSTVDSHRVKDADLPKVTPSILQLGGNETTGQGLTRLVLGASA